MLGHDMLYAPVVKQNTDTVEVYFPEGRWEHLFTGQTYDGRQILTVEAPLGTPAVFVRQGELADIVQQARAIR